MGRREERFAGYRRARLVVRGVAGRTLTLRPELPGVVTGTFPFAGPVHVLTAYDPGPARLDAAENARRQRVLVAQLPPEARVWDAETGAEDGSHTELGALVEGLPDGEALAIGRRHGQDAIFRWTRTAWSILPCDGSSASQAGWSLEG